MEGLNFRGYAPKNLAFIFYSTYPFQGPSKSIFTDWSLPPRQRIPTKSNKKNRRTPCARTSKGGTHWTRLCQVSSVHWQSGMQPLVTRQNSPKFWEFTGERTSRTRVSIHTSMVRISWKMRFSTPNFLLGDPQNRSPLVIKHGWLGLNGHLKEHHLV